ncbi:MAG: U32 family peptidase, partial [Bacteroidaceae bacterium]|nr:U32 family peptidase [Bacteroidaceae bacterium]
VKLYSIGVDALIIQDLGILEMDIPPIPLHASTQMDNRTPEKVAFLSKAGLPRVVLARELSLEEISAIHNAVPDVEIEAFVHGALCVSYSGQCYASQHCFGRSANKGECAQFCRLPFDLVDAEGSIIARQKHFLSLKDMNRSAYIEQMMDAGVVSFKIEGRLKDVSYVKNITAHYRKQIDAVLARRPQYVRSSFGGSELQFVPSPYKSFNRGFTDYFLSGKRGDISSFDTPKSMGEPVGRVRVVSRQFFTMQEGVGFNNGDGVCFIGNDGRLHGFRINRVDGARIFPQSMPPLFPGTMLYRNSDIAFERELARPDAPRRLSLSLYFGECADGFTLSAKDESGVEVSLSVPFAKEEARKPQSENIKNQLSKWGNTPFVADKVDVNLSKEWFLPSSLLSDIRRKVCDALIEEHKKQYAREERNVLPTSHPYVESELSYLGNVSNSLARKFYKRHSVEKISPAFEVEPVAGVPIMYCKHCIKYSLGWCSKSGERHCYKEPFFLISGDGRKFRLQFD